MFSVCIVIVPGLAHSPGVTGQVGNYILQNLLKVLIHLKHIRTNKKKKVTFISTSTSICFYMSIYFCACRCCTRLNSYQGLISDQGIPDAGHGLANAQVGVKLVAVETGHELGQEWSQLLPGLGCDHVKTKSCSLIGGEVRWKEE